MGAWKIVLFTASNDCKNDATWFIWTIIKFTIQNQNVAGGKDHMGGHGVVGKLYSEGRKIKMSLKWFNS